MGQVIYPREEELKQRIGDEYFEGFDCATKLGDIDFAVSIKKESCDSDHPTYYFLWAEAKREPQKHPEESLVQLIFTIGKAKTNQRYYPPKYLAAFDPEKITFIEYNKVASIFRQIDFNWNVKPSDYSTKEFKQLWTIVHQAMYIDNGMIPIYCFDFHSQGAELKTFIKTNFVTNSGDTRLMDITEDNVAFVFDDWCKTVKPTISVRWEDMKEIELYPIDFFLADMLSVNNDTEKVRSTLSVLLKGDRYVFTKKTIRSITNENTAGFVDRQMTAHHTFWSKFYRPPESKWHDPFIQMRGNFVPLDVRERQGTFFTPNVWRAKSQEYLTTELGENWRDEYYIWDCCAGSGALLYGINRPYRTWASDIDENNVKNTRAVYCKEDNSGSLLESHVFQFDFLNDAVIDAKLPDDLREILLDAEERKKLIIYINPPYAEATSNPNGAGINRPKPLVATNNDIYERYGDEIGNASNELFALFFIRIFNEFNGCILATFSTLKPILGTNFATFRKRFTCKLKRAFLVPADTFDNVNGQFPIGFFIWYTDNGIYESECTAEMFDRKNKFIGYKHWDTFVERDNINQWIKKFDVAKEDIIGHMICSTPNFQAVRYLTIQINKSTQHSNHFAINVYTLIPACIYFAVRKCIRPTWINDRDQFWYPKDGWQTDSEFQNDCLIFTLFHGQNRISMVDGVNYWIPFTEDEVLPRRRFKEHFMTDFMSGECKADVRTDCVFEDMNIPSFVPTQPLVFSPEAKTVLDAGRTLWKYYHDPRHPNTDPDASFYDIRLYFQGSDTKGRMHGKSEDEQYNLLRATLNQYVNALGDKIAHKVSLYGFIS